ncbi:M20 family peptidase [Hymenobacter arizonensis]|uniref:Carboxypeptidase PM20D1 n=1 Tax=Hymenobacter arizonensis TaxID=1227077 RepID=A0A1I6ASA8_HYMAR|nr:M20 family peptidase [Hymenobacter arizonensis]SFQ71591.1 carboxypeptidase PM20D1 [Hymenobacter arizonensis]
MRKFLLVLALALLVLIGVLAFNTQRLKSHQLTNVQAAPVLVLPDSALARLVGALRIPTVSTTDFTQTDTAQFSRFGRHIRQAFPRVHQQLKLEHFNTHGLLYTWQGSNPALKPVLLMGHYDVVPVLPGTESKWAQPPFAARQAGGYLYARGTLDDKASVLAQLEAVEYLLVTGFQPTRTILLAFGQDEENLGRRGAAAIAAALKQRGTQLEYVLDEGGIVKTDGVAGIKKDVALVGICEKGYLSLELTATGKGGHSAMPPAQTSIGAVAAAIVKLEQHPFAARLEGGDDHLLDYLASEVPLGQRVVFSNRWLFAPIIKKMLAATPATNATMRTTTAPTIFHAGAKENVLPIDATATVNFRLLPGDSVAGVMQEVRRIIADENIRLRIVGQPSNPSPVSNPEAPAFQQLHRTIRSVFPAAIVAPYVVTGATDARQYAALSPNVYRFSPTLMNQEGIESIHGSNERLQISNYPLMVQFYASLIRNSQ